MIMALRKLKNRFYIYYRDQDGKHRTLSLGTSDPVKAQAEHDRLWALIQSAKVAQRVIARHAMIFPDAVIKEIERGNPIPERVPREKKRLKLKEMIPLAQQYRDINERTIREFNAFCSAIHCTYADEVTPEIAVSYLEHRFGGGNGKTYNNHKSQLNTIFRCCLIQAGLAKSPFDSVINKKVRKVEHHRPLTVEEFRKAYAAAREPWKTASLISWHTALRRESCFRLAWEHISIENGIPSITIMPGKTARFGRAVYIPIHAELWERLNAIPRPEDDKTPILSQFPSVWSWIGGKPTYYVGLLKSLGICDNKEGKASFHSLRVSFVTRCDEEQINRTATRGITGQVDDHTTDLYSHDKVNAMKILELPAAGIDTKCM